MADIHIVSTKLDMAEMTLKASARCINTWSDDRGYGFVSVFIFILIQIQILILILIFIFILTLILILISNPIFIFIIMIQIPGLNFDSEFKSDFYFYYDSDT